MKTLYTHLIGLTRLALVFFFIFLVPIQSHARDASFTWTANPEPLTGYKLYYKTGGNDAPPYEGTGLNEGDSPIFLNKVATFTVTGLLPNETYKFVIIAYNEAGESDYSTVVSILPLSFPSPTINVMSQN